jgi:hypothetical protein
MEIPEVMALGAGIGHACVADLPDFGKERWVGLGRIAETGPVGAGSSFDDVINGSEGKAPRMDMPMNH